MPSANAPPDPPSPVTMTMIGTGRAAISIRLWAMASACPAFFGIDPGIGSRSVDECDDRTLETGAEVHDPHGLAIALRSRHAEVPAQFLGSVPPLLVPHHNHRISVEARQSGHDRGIVRKPPVAVKLREIGKNTVGVGHRVGPVGVTRKLALLPWRQLRKDPLDDASSSFLAASGQPRFRGRMSLRTPDSRTRDLTSSMGSRKGGVGDAILRL